MSSDISEMLVSFWCLFNTIFHLIFGGIPCFIVSSIMMLFMDKIYVQKFVCYWASVYFKLIIWSSGISIYVSGLENIDMSKAYMFACNHTSFFDGPLMYSILPHWVSPIAKVSISKIPLFGWLVKQTGTICINKNDTYEAIKVLNDASEVVRKHPRSVLVFPEGKRSEDGRLCPFKVGCFVFGIQTGLPIVPVAISGCDEVWGKALSVFRMIRYRTPIKIIVGKPILVDGFDEQTDKYNLRDIVYEEIMKLQSDNVIEFKKIELSFVRCFMVN